MGRDDSLLRAILEEPDDDGVRLVYADWLEEHGDVDRAEFIRVQLDLARGDPRPNVLRRLRERERVLLREHELRWTAPLHGLVQRARFRRGFPECVTVGADEFLAQADALFRLAPVRHLILTEGNGRLKKLVKLPHLGRAPTLEFRTYAPADVPMLVGSLHLGTLTGLILRYGAIDENDAAALADAPTLPRLTALDLYGCGLTSAAVGTLAASGHLGRLTDLVLGDNFQIGDAGAEALAGPHTRLTRLERLHLSFAGIGDAGARALAASPALTNLRALDLGYNAIGADGARALADSPHLRSLKRLGLCGNPLGRRTRQALAARLAGRIRL
jgi:uncharacterized protein (TIGR02996 family)